MNRRSFFGFAAAAPIAGQMAAAEFVMPPKAMKTLTLGLDAAPLKAAIGEATSIIGQARAIQFGGGDRRYRTGNPAIDDLRSISGVHRALMERRAERGAS